MISHDQAPGIPEPVVINNAWQTYGLLAGFGLSIPVFFVTTYGWVVWIVGPLLVRRLYRFRHRQNPDSGQLRPRRHCRRGAGRPSPEKIPASLGLPDQSLFNKPQN